MSNSTSNTKKNLPFLEAVTPKAFKGSVIELHHPELGFAPENTQGLLVNGYDRAMSRHYFFEITDPQKALHLFSKLATQPEIPLDAGQAEKIDQWHLHITNAVRYTNKGKYDGDKNIRHEVKPLSYELNVAFTQAGFKALLAKACNDTDPVQKFLTPYDQAFINGPVRKHTDLPDAANRHLKPDACSTTIAETIGDRGPSAPKEWIKGFAWKKEDTPPKLHVIITIYSNSENEAAQLENELKEIIKHNGSPLSGEGFGTEYSGVKSNGGFSYIQTNDQYIKEDGKGRAWMSDLSLKEQRVVKKEGNSGYIHFGYKDGISQPRIKHWTKHDYRDGGQGDVPPQAVLRIDPQKKWIKDCSFAAFRILEQDVEAFDHYLTDKAEALKHLHPENPKELLAAKLVGRWRNGNPLMLAPKEEGKRLPTGELDNYLYDHAKKDNSQSEDQPQNTETDPFGTVCPFSSHMRRSNPRDTYLIGGVNYMTHHRRIMRRAQPYGKVKDFAASGPDTEKRGLAGYFISPFIDHSFEFVMKAWVNESELFAAKAQPNEVDPILGFRPDPGQKPKCPFSSQFTIPEENTSNGKNLVIDGMPRFVTTKAGAYVFFPSIEMLKNQFKIS